MLIKNVEIGHREQTKLPFVSPIFDGQFHEMFYPCEENLPLNYPIYEFRHVSYDSSSYQLCLTMTNLLKLLEGIDFLTFKLCNRNNN
jgi:hypothetical protein